MTNDTCLFESGVWGQTNTKHILRQSPSPGASAANCAEQSPHEDGENEHECKDMKEPSAALATVTEDTNEEKQENTE